MAHANIYIRKDNEEMWNGIKNKSSFVNALLARHIAGERLSHEKVGKLQDAVKQKVAEEIVVEPEDTRTVDVFKSDYGKPNICQHGSDHRLCKHAKFDKSRKEKWCK